MPIPEIISTIQCTLGEGPLWDAKNNCLYWTDILENTIYCFSPETGSIKSYTTNSMVGCMVLHRHGDLLAATQKGFERIDVNTGKQQALTHPEKHIPTNRFNDGKCDARGRFWAGTLSLTEEKGAGSLYVLHNNLYVTKVLDNLTISNGMAWNNAETKMYFIDSVERCVVQFDYEPSMPHISNKKTIIHIPHEDGLPDGMTIDTEGMLWIAHWDGWKVSRYNPNTGEELMHFKLPVSRVTNCVFGGAALEDIYITTARKGLSAQELEQQPLAGSTFVIKNSGFTGVPASSFIQQHHHL